ncbi:TraM recognition domain-containing protein [Photobacterium kishitanii]|uniref:Uncharacterized protein n=1 Tax=Photobacterium kishitanii TaxID=318456 RepID=A0A2T3KN07_9GAMM|nr:TraM recognition domain-containing protein [Photobacterium kishitanii]PSV01197.1 hypothetical protein C9J27_04005 [Photobacterium kishitanii]
MGIGFSLIFAGQDYQAFKKGSEPEAASIKANCGTKLAMAMEDSGETAEIFVDGAGKAYVEVDTGLERESGTFGVSYIKKREVSFEERDKINVLDLKAQPPGMFHLLSRDRVVRGMSFYANPRQMKELRVNSFIKVKPPGYNEREMIKTSLNELKMKFSLLNNEGGKKLDSAWNNLDGSEMGEFSSNMKHLVGMPELMQAAFAMALRKNHIDIVNREMILKLKEYEAIVNRKVDPTEEFHKETAFKNVSDEDLKQLNEDALKKESTEERLLRKIKENEQIILNNLDINNNPLSFIDYEIDDTNDVISELSNAIISKWKELGILDDNTIALVTKSSMQDDLAYLSCQDILLTSVEQDDDNVSDFEPDIEDIDIIDFEEDFEDD